MFWWPARHLQIVILRTGLVNSAIWICTLCSLASPREPSHQRRLVPESEHLLVVPVLAFFAELHVKVEEQPRQDATHLNVRKAAGSARIRYHQEWTYFRPMQFLGPMENGCMASRLSFSYRLGHSGSQRSGTNVSGSVKFAAEWNIVQL